MLMDFDQFKEKYNIRGLNPQQEEAVKAVDGNILLLAVPGSGKTTVLVTRLAYMMFARNIAPESILTMTYTKAATADMKKRFESRFGEELGERLQFRTINAVCYMILRYYAQITGGTLPPVIDESERSSMISRLYKDINGEWPTELEKKNVGTGITFCKNMMLSDDEIEEYGKEIRNFKIIYDRYNAELRKLNKIDFDDQMVYAYRILRKYPDILTYFRDRWKYICVDESQDTSKIQHFIIRALAAGLSAEPSDSNLFMVGDEDQSIYYFRAAYPQALYEFENTYKNAKVLLMETNYRSTNAIVRVADAFIRKNDDRHPKSMVASRNEAGPEVQISRPFRSDEHYKALINIADNCTCETAVLYRDNDSAIPIIDMLSREKVGYKARGLDSLFFSNPVVLDVIGIISFARGGCKDREFFAKNYFKLGLYMKKTEAAVLLSLCQDGEDILHLLSTTEDFRISDRVKDNAPAVSYAMRRIGKGLLTASQTMELIEEDIGYEQFLNYRNTSARPLRILDAIAKYEPTPDRLLARMTELQEIIKNGTTDPNAKFSLSTIHGSKGLEYDTCIIIDCVDGILPSVSKDKSHEQYQEERRLFYVAMTRAKNSLYILQYVNKNSEFLSEIRSYLLDRTVIPTPAASHPVPPPSPKHADTLNPDSLQPGMAITHKVYGKGKIEARTGRIITVKFDNKKEPNRFDVMVLCHFNLVQI